MLTKKDFVTIKKGLEGSENINMVYDNTQIQRYDYISKQILGFCKDIGNKQINIVDIGCGEGFFMSRNY